MPCAFEQADVNDGRRYQRRGDRTDARDSCQAACVFILPCMSDNLRFECPDTFSLFTALVEESLEDLTRLLREGPIRVDQLG